MTRPVFPAGAEVAALAGRRAGRAGRAVMSSSFIGVSVARPSKAATSTTTRRGSSSPGRCSSTMATRSAAFSMMAASSTRASISTGPSPSFLGVVVHDDARQRAVLGDELSAQVAESDGLLPHDRLLPVWQSFDDVISTLSDMRSCVKHLFDIGVAEFSCRRASGAGRRCYRDDLPDRSKQLTEVTGPAWHNGRAAFPRRTAFTRRAAR